MDSKIDWMLILAIIGAVGALPVAYIVIKLIVKFIRFIRKFIQFMRDMEGLKSTIDKDKDQISRDKVEVMEHMNYAMQYRNEARQDKMEIEQIKETVARDREEMTKKAQAIDSQLSSAQARAMLRSTSDKRQSIIRKEADFLGLATQDTHSSEIEQFQEWLSKLSKPRQEQIREMLSKLSEHERARMIEQIQVMASRLDSYLIGWLRNEFVGDE